ncbi:MAG TPA: CopG family transcriptional regulator [Bacillota bacterium]|nr:CopG family transcriptional regulator [Bacillota bacterium]
MAQKFTISIPDELVNTLDSLAIAWKTTRSGVFARLLQETERKCLEKEMEEGYKAMAENDVELYLLAQAEVVLRIAD